METEKQSDEEAERVRAQIATLKKDGKIRVSDGEKVFYVLCKSWKVGFPYGYAPSLDGKKPADKFRMYSTDELWNWLSHLEPA